MDHKAHVRPALTDDASSIGELAERASLFPAALLPEMIGPYLDGSADALWLVATQGSRIVGFAFAQPEPLTDGTWNLRAIGVHPDHRRLGIASDLIDALEQALRNRHVRLLIVDTSDSGDQAAARRLYVTRAYSEEARIREFWEAGVAKVTFAKQLRS